MILYEVRDADGELIMHAPMLTISRILGLSDELIARIERETRELDDESTLEFEGAPHASWAQIHIQRLPLTIPQVDN